MSFEEIQNRSKPVRKESSFMEWIIAGGIALLVVGGTIVYRKVLGKMSDESFSSDFKNNGPKPTHTSSNSAKPSCTRNGTKPVSSKPNAATKFVAASFRMEQCSNGTVTPEQAESLFVDSRYWWSGDGDGLESLKREAGLSDIGDAPVEGAELLVAVYALPLDEPLSSRFSGSASLGEAAKARTLKIEGVYRPAETGLTAVGFSR